MADETCVALKCDVKKIFDKNLTKPILKQIEDTISSAVNKTKGLTFDPKCKDGWLLTGNVVSLDVDDPANPTSLEVKITIDGLAFGKSATAFNAKSSGKQSGVRAKKIEEDAKSLVDTVFDDLMKKQVVKVLTSD